MLPLLNGVDVYSRVRSIIKKGVVLPACVYVGTHIERPGKVFQKGGACKILFGPDPLRPDFAPRDVIALFDKAGIKSELMLNIQVETWTKFIFICAYGLVSAAYGKTLGEILEDGILSANVQTIMMEAVSIAKASGVSLPSDIVVTSLSKARSFPFEAKTSFQRDVERMDMKDERDLFVGTMFRMADELCIQVPGTKAVSTMLAKRKAVNQSKVV